MGRKGAGHNFQKNDTAQGHNINIKINRVQEDKSNSIKPWSSICKLNDTPRGARTVPNYCQKTQEWVVPQWLEWPSHSLAYEVTELGKTNHITSHGPHSWSVLLSKSEQIHLLPVAVSLAEFFCNETSRAWGLLGPKTGCHRFWPGSSHSRTQLSDKAQHRVPALRAWFPILGKRFQAQLLEMER